MWSLYMVCGDFRDLQPYVRSQALDSDNSMSTRSVGANSNLLVYMHIRM